MLPVTGQGIVVEPLSDAIGLRITQAGFVLSGGPAGLALSPAATDARGDDGGGGADTDCSSFRGKRPKSWQAGQSARQSPPPWRRC